MRLDRLLANHGLGSRAEVSRMVRDGAVTVGGLACRDPSRHAAPADVLVHGEPIDHPDGVLVALHKPVGFICSHDDGEGPTVFSLLPASWQRRSPRPEAVGRLDKDTSGLLLVTDDHALVHRLTSPRSGVPKTYVASLARPVTPELIEQLTSGRLTLRGETAPCAPAGTEALNATTLALTITEGRYHQVRRMIAACGNHVESLHRTAVGGCRLGELAAGSWRDVRREELA